MFTFDIALFNCVLWLSLMLILFMTFINGTNNHLLNISNYNPSQLDHYNDGGLSSLLTNHRRTRHKKYTQSPLSGSGSLTPNSNQTTLYSTLSFQSHRQHTENAVSGMNGDYYWSRGDQSYFDVVCPGYYQRMGMMHAPKKKIEKKLEEEKKYMEEEDDVCCSKSNNNKINPTKSQTGTKANESTTPPMLNLSLFAKRGGKGGKQITISPNIQKKGSGHDEYDGEGQYVGECSINITRVLTGKTPYFDEWCTLHNDNIAGLTDPQEGAGQVRVVIEYEPTDSPPRSGDVCIFANVYPEMEKEFYPIPLYTVRTNRPLFRHSSGSIVSFDKSTSASSTTLSSAGSSSLSSTKSCTISQQQQQQLIRTPKQFTVEECVGDHVVLSYQTPENWHVTFEIHRYNLLVTHRYCGTVEKVQESLLDFCDNISQSPMVEVLSKTVELLPEEGLVYVGAEAVGAGVSVLGRWMEVGLSGALEDVVDAANLDGRYSHLSDEEEDEEEEMQQEGGVGRESSSPLKSVVANADLEEPSDEKEALPGMPCCPITGQPSKFVLRDLLPILFAPSHLTVSLFCSWPIYFSD
jgi:hypothetical protein